MKQGGGKTPSASLWKLHCSESVPSRGLYIYIYSKRDFEVHGCWRSPLLPLGNDNRPLALFGDILHPQANPNPGHEQGKQKSLSMAVKASPSDLGSPVDDSAQRVTQQGFEVVARIL